MELSLLEQLNSLCQRYSVNGAISLLQEEHDLSEMEIDDLLADYTAQKQMLTEG